MIQDIEPKQFYNQFREAEIAKGDDVFVFHERTVLIKEGRDELAYPRYGEADFGEQCKKADFIYLFSVDEQRYFLLMPEREISIPGYVYESMYQMRGRQEKYQVMAASTAWHLYVWYRDHQFCGRCGSRTVPDQKQRMLRCPDCGNMIFPRLLPAVIVAVTDGDRILLTKYANRVYKRYALIAGFVEIGETVEDTVRREVMEEVGIHVKNIRYYKTQPWGFDQDILIGYFCEADHERTIHMDREELSVAEWVKREDVPDYGENLSLTHEMMLQFKNGEIG